FAEIFVDGERVFREADHIVAWVSHEIDLMKYAGQTVTLTFRLASDAGVSGTIGWQVDQIRVVSGSADSDGDGVPDECDLCPGEDDNVDVNGNGIPDACDVEAPILAPSPHDILKNRYISIDPRGANEINAGKDLDIRLTLTSTLVSGVTAVGSQWWANAPDADCIAVVGPTRPAVPPNWDACPTLHLTGCPIIPTPTSWL
ncbi:MAG: hypothetical protein IH856_10910, partial [Deltaproteobacteria bacterium]|nr:hypothetical protein [Deltaproteobacteria bacterium]